MDHPFDTSDKLETLAAVFFSLGPARAPGLFGNIVGAIDGIAVRITNPINYYNRKIFLLLVCRLLLIRTKE